MATKKTTPHVYSKYPMFLHHADGRSQIVRSDEEADRMAEQGFGADVVSQSSTADVPRVVTGDCKNCAALVEKFNSKWEGMQDEKDLLELNHENLKTSFDVLKAEQESLKIENQALDSECNSLKGANESLKAGHQALKLEHEALKAEHEAATDQLAATAEPAETTGVKRKK